MTELGERNLTERKLDEIYAEIEECKLHRQ